MNQVSIGSDNGLLPIQHQAIISTNSGLLSIGPLGTNVSEMLIKIQNFSFTKNASENIVCEMAAILSGGDKLIPDSGAHPAYIFYDFYSCWTQSGLDEHIEAMLSERLSPWWKIRGKDIIMNTFQMTAY